MSKPVQPKMLVADDDENIARIVMSAAEDTGFQTQYVSDGVELLKIFDSFQPDYIVLDISMPNMDGIETLFFLNKEQKEVDIIIISGQQAYREWAESMGTAHNLRIIANIPKPFRVADLKKVFSNIAAAFADVNPSRVTRA